MRIVQICPYAMERPGGVQRHVRDFAAWCETQGHPTRIVAPPKAGTRGQASSVLTEIGSSRLLGAHGTEFELSWASPFAVRTLASKLRNWNADMVHLHTPWTPWVAGQMHRALGLPTVTTVHATLPTRSSAGLIDRYIHRKARHFLTASQAIVTPSSAPIAMLKHLDPDCDPQILPPCIDLSGFSPAGSKTPTSFLFLGRLEPRKGLDILIQAWPQIAAALPSAHLTIAGDGPLRNSASGLTNTKIIGRPSDPELHQLMGETAFFLAPAPYGESYGLVLAEAMAAGTMPIAANNPGYASVLADLPDCLVSAGDPDSLAERVIKVAMDPPELPLTEVAALSDVRTVGPRYIELFQQVVAGA